METEKVIIDEYIFDPNGDTLYILKNPDKPITIDLSGGKKRSLPSSDPPKSASKRVRTSSGEYVQPASDSFVYGPPDEVHCKVSGSHLALASPVFRTMISGSWSESSIMVANGTQEGSLRQLTSSEWDSEAICIMFHIMHNRYKSVPRGVGLKLLTSIATVADYYKCHEIFDIFLDEWISVLKRENSVPSRTVFGEDVVRWLSIAWVFARTDIFDLVSETIVRHSTGPILVPDLPVAPALGMLEDKRQELVSKLLVYVARIQKALCLNQTQCTMPECSTMLLGTLVTAMQPFEHLKDEEKRPKDGYSLAKIMEALTKHRKPYWAAIRHNHAGRPEPAVHSCSLNEFLQRPLRKIETELKQQVYNNITKALGTSAPGPIHRWLDPALTDPIRRVEERPKAALPPA
ncbi:unnamed protein product [Clonostachys rosea]|uniref:BTB domain-containing protein n=1 Tax=Bionectria ochroleuca TaxID=29856 RepID=A0ABY6V3W3_BIOOC|nr:unnamed protein product [Clonostachys rosea]